MLGEDPDAVGDWAEAWCIDLLEHGVEPLLAELRSVQPHNIAAADVLRVERGYFTTNAARMDYPTFRAHGLPIGSGAVESAAKHVVQVRMKRSGMRWSRNGGEALLALCAYGAGNRPLTLPEVRSGEATRGCLHDTSATACFRVYPVNWHTWSSSWPFSSLPTWA